MIPLEVCYEIPTLSDNLVDIPLYFESVKVVHRLDGVDIFVDHANDI